MSATTRAAASRRAARPAKTNRIGLEKTLYRGRPSTLCKGCGHDSISQRIVNTAWGDGPGSDAGCQTERNWL